MITSTSLSPIPRQQFVDQTGRPLSSGLLFTYQASTTNLLATYTDASGVTTNANPIVLDALGGASVWLGTGAYKFVLQDSAGNTIWVVDNIVAPAFAALADLSAATGSDLIGFQRPNGVPRTVSNRLMDTYHLNDYGAEYIGGVVDCTSLLQSAVNDIASHGGGRLILPEGDILITGTVNLVAGVVLEGAPLQEFAGNFGSTVPSTRGFGTWIKSGSPEAQPFLQPAGINSVGLRNLSFFQDQPVPAAGWTPTVYPPCIRLLGSGALLEKLYFFGCYAGIDIGGSGMSTGRSTLKHIYGEFFSYGIRTLFSADTQVLDDIHIYPFWSTLESHVKAYAEKNTFGIVSARNDNPMWSNIFCGGVNRGIYLTSTSDGSTFNLTCNNWDLDFCSNGILCDASACTASFSNGGSQPGPDATLTNSRGFLLVGTSCRFFFTNTRFARTNAECIAILGNNNIAGFSNLHCDSWDDQNAGIATCITSSNSNKIALSGLIDIGTHTATTAFLGGDLSSYNWPNVANSAQAGGTTNASGEVTVTHELGFVPNVINITSLTAYQFVLVVTAKTTTTFTVRAYTSNTGSAATSAAIAFSWQANM